ncbi:hypothetical protein IKQ65_03030 [Candidatus Saccharibacteria bacterium]|nr:hypothetical protein [Candidatus Saccharibacteria bacterium]MBR6961873.1 hypothetical protein [Candidatus Saccharibacteria bacterium]
MRNKKIIGLVVGSFAAAAVLIVTLTTGGARADSSGYDRNLITTKAMLQGVRFAVEYGDADDRDPKYFNSFSNLSAFTDAASLINTGSIYADKKQTIPLPGVAGGDGLYHNNKTAVDGVPRLIINDIFLGNSETSSIFSRTKNPISATHIEWSDKYLTEKLAYKKTDGKVSKSCFRFKVDVTWKGKMTKPGGYYPSFPVAKYEHAVFDSSWSLTEPRYTAQICALIDSSTRFVDSLEVFGVNHKADNYDADYSAKWRAGSWTDGNPNNVLLNPFTLNFEVGPSMDSMWSWNVIVGTDLGDLGTPYADFSVPSFSNNKGNNVFKLDESAKTIEVSRGVPVSYQFKLIGDFKNDLLNAINSGAATRTGATMPSVGSRAKASGYLVFSAPYKCTEKPQWNSSPEYFNGNYVAICHTGYGANFAEQVSTSTAIIEETQREVGDGSYTAPASSDKYKVVAGLTGYTGDLGDSAKVKQWAVEHAYLTKSEQISLYMDYLNNEKMLNGIVKCGIDGANGAYGEPIKWFEPGKTTLTKGCYVTNQTGTMKFNSVVDNGAIEYPSNAYKFAGSFIGAGTIDLQGLMEFFRDLPDNTVLDFPSDSASNTTPTPGEGSEPGDGDLGEAEKDCYNSAGSSNWIACPIIENGTSASTVMYSFIENMLQVNTKLFSTDGKVNGTFDAWGSFRNIANIVFIIIFIIVIISQVTGVGIDNYGIKKILPKLILGALLVNISFFVCQASVDVANIAGGGIKKMLDGITHDMVGSQEIKFAFDQAKTVKTATGVGAAALLVAIVAAAWHFSGGSILVPILLGVIGIIIGIIFLLILLAVRQGLAVILVVISPLAFIAYMLPNTKGLFSKWIKVFSATLLAYPMCSLVVYGGQMVSTILLLAASDGAVTNFALALTAAILSIAPVFFIPSLIMKSMSGISTVANGLKSRATSLGKGAFDRSHTAENMRNVAAAKKEQMNVRRAQSTIDRLKGRNNLNTGERARLRTAQNVKDSYLKKNADLYGGMTKTMGKKALADMGRDAFNGGYDAEKFDAAVAQLFATGNDDEAFALIDEVSSNTAFMDNPEQLEKFKTTLATRGGTIGKAYAKVLGSNDDHMSFATAMGNGAMGKAFSGMGANVLAGMTKDEMGFLASKTKDDSGNDVNRFNLSSMFNAEQLATAAATHTSGKAEEKFNELLGGVSNADRDGARSKLSAEQWAKVSALTLNSLFSDGSGNVDTAGLDAFNDKMAQSIVNSGDGELMSTISGEKQKAAIRQINDAKAAAAAAKTKAELQARDSQQRFQQNMARAVNEIKDNMKRPPETFSDGGGI